MRRVLALCILCLIPLTAFTKQPIGFKHWQHDDTTFTKQIGGAVRNYQRPDKAWDSIVNGFEIEGDSVVYVDKAVLRTRVNKDGVSKVMLTWDDQEYTVTQKMLGIGWIKISTRQSQWIDSTMDWSNFSVDSNICKWTGVSPGVDYRVRKSNGTVEHGIFYKPAFLDSAVTLYNQRPDSLDIALANVMVYTLSSNIDNADSAMGDLPWRRLKDFGYYSFNLRDQWLRFPGCDTLPQIPVRQYWERRGTKIICIEYVMMSKVKKVHEAYPGATIWHNDSKVIEGTTNVEDAYIDQYNPDNNYGGATLLKTYTWGSWGQAIFIRVKNVASELGVGATLIACVCSLYCSENTTDGVIDAYSNFKPWVEGDDNGVNNDDGDVTYNDFQSDALEFATEGCICADDDGVDNSNDDGDCTSANADRKETAESSTEVTTTGWWSWSVTSALAQAWYDETKNEEGIFLLNRALDNNDNDFTSTEGASNQPFWVFTYTTESLPVEGFGYGSTCGLTTTIENRIWATRDTPEFTGTLDSAKVYLYVTTAQHNVKMAVYKVSDSTLVDQTEEILVGIGSAWIYFDFTGNDSIFASTEYAIAVVSEVAAGECEVGFNTSGGNGSHWGQASFTYGAWPSPKWTTLDQSGSYCFSIYAYYSYTPASDVVRAIQCPDGAFQVSGPNPSYISGP